MWTPRSIHNRRSTEELTESIVERRRLVLIEPAAMLQLLHNCRFRAQMITLTTATYGAAGITLPRTADAQFRAGPRVLALSRGPNVSQRRHGGIDRSRSLKVEGARLRIFD
jgi:hypothetical protein